MATFKNAAFAVSMTVINLATNKANACDLQIIGLPNLSKGTKVADSNVKPSITMIEGSEEDQLSKVQPSGNVKIEVTSNFERSTIISAPVVCATNTQNKKFVDVQSIAKSILHPSADRTKTIRVYGLDIQTRPGNSIIVCAYKGCEIKL